MRNTVSSLMMLITLGILSCHKTTQVDANAYPLTEYTLDLQQANRWLLGQWTLVKVAASTPNPTVPNVVLIIDEHHIRLIQDGKQTDQLDYTLVKTQNGLLIKTNAQSRADNWYVRDPSLMLNQKQLYLDLGRAHDLPAYSFDKVI